MPHFKLSSKAAVTCKGKGHRPIEADILYGSPNKSFYFTSISFNPLETWCTADIRDECSMAEKVLNPAPLGLAGFGFTTVLLNLVNAGIMGTSALPVVLAMGIFYGGLAQVFAGLLEARLGNTFGAVAFTSYGLFWLATVGLIMGFFGELTPAAMAAYLAGWGVFTAYMTIAAMKHANIIKFVFITLTILFFLLAAGEFNVAVHIIGGYEGIICGASAIYASAAIVVNDSYGRRVLPT